MPPRCQRGAVEQWARGVNLAKCSGAKLRISCFRPESGGINFLETAILRMTRTDFLKMLNSGSAFF